MRIEHHPGTSNGFFKAIRNERGAGTISYKQESAWLITVEHTVVEPEFKGMGIGSELLTALVAYARAENLRVRPVCPFARSMFEKTPEFRDVLHII